MILRGYQVDLIDGIHQVFEDGARLVCAVAPTGCGKTVAFADIARRVDQAGTRTCIIVHRDTLLQQASAKLRECGVKHSVIAPGHSFFGDLVSVASVQTLVRRLDRYEFELLIIDEAHHSVSATYRKILDRWPAAHVLGFTATPSRTDGQGLGAVFDHIVLGPSIAALIQDGYLVEPVYTGARHLVDLSAVRSRMGDFDQTQLATAMDRREITGDAIEHYAQLCNGEPAVAFCVNIQHAEDVAADFKAAGYRSACVHGKMPLAEIRRLIASLGRGLDVLTSCDLVSEGVDIPAIRTVIGLRPTQSPAVNLQQVGRALRPVYAAGYDLANRAGRLAAIAASEKPNALILDHAGNCFRPGIGFADDEREWTLEGRKRRAGTGGAVVAVRQCPKCFRCHRPGPVCPACGHVYVVETSAPRMVDGEMVKIDKDALRRVRARKIAAARTYNELKAVAKEIGYSSQWAWRLYLERGGGSAHA